MSERDLTQAELARRAGVTRAAINGILTGARGPGPDLCLAIAGALHLSPETVFRAAGLLPQSPDITPNLEDANHLFAQLSPEDQADILALIRTKIERRDKNKRGGNTPG